jgi:hypothetical protein
MIAHCVGNEERRCSSAMRILTVSDKVEPALYGPHIRERVGAIDLILACGDLPYYYLEYVESLLDAPLYFVHGNHDVPLKPATLAEQATPFEWAINLHRRTISHKGLLLAGLEGCRVYNPGAPFQYTEAQVSQQVFWLGWALRRNRVRYGRYLDILVTHSPPYSIHDGRDVAHTGFFSYLALLRRYCPVLMVHGHHHIYNRSSAIATDHEYYGVHVINTYPYRIIELAREGSGRWRLVNSRQ